MKHQRVFDILTPKEAAVFRVLAENNAPTVSEMAKVLNAAKHGAGNAVSAHIRNIRLKLHKHKLPYEIRNRHGYGIYQLIQH